MARDSAEEALERARRAEAIADAARWEARKFRLEAEELEDRLRASERRRSRAESVRRPAGNGAPEPVAVVAAERTPSSGAMEEVEKRAQRAEAELAQLRGELQHALLRAKDLEKDLFERMGMEAAEVDLRRLAFENPVVGLPNEHFVLQQLTARLVQGHCATLVLVDVDRFRRVGEYLGEAQARELLGQLADRLRESLENDEAVGFRGPDQFLLLASVAGGEDEDSSSRVAQRLGRRVTQKVKKLFSQPGQLEGHPFSFKCSIGISISPGDARTPEDMLENAEQTVRTIKNRGGNRAEFFSGDTRVQVVQRRNLIEGVRRAYQGGEFAVLLEPVIDIKPARFKGAWTHLRWNHPELGVLKPDSFREPVEEAGMYSYVRDLAVMQGCWHFHQHGFNGSLFVSIPAGLLLHEDFPQRFMQAISGSQLPADRVVLFLEGSLEQLPQHKLATSLDGILPYGVGLGSDAFPETTATRLLMRSARRYATIPEDLVLKLPDEEPEASLCAGLMKAAGILEIQCVGNGVKTQEQLEFLAFGGCSLARGPLYCLPTVPAQLGPDRGASWSF
ncbi:MAG: EAL domain-containing protein [Armatimonadetes bacterium]|nr:EAL domain-containing protein [Armatimonadota bacterium]